jgi:hypothetical protein
MRSATACSVCEQAWLGENKVEVYFVTVGKKDEIEVIKKLRPSRLLCSYWYFKSKRLGDLCDAIGYQPEIMLDSGAFSAFSSGKNLSLLDYMKYIQNNAPFVTRYIALDVIGDSYTTRAYYDIMRGKGFDPIPVYHYGDDLETMEYYISAGANVVALGNTVPIQDKRVVAAWCMELHRNYPGVALHLLGSSSPKIINCGALSSCDSSSWYMLAVNGYPKAVSGQTARAEVNMRNMMEASDDCSVPVINRRGECADG